MELSENTLVILPARGGSKGIPGKNIKPLAGKPLLHYAIDTARQVVPEQMICLSTDDKAIAASAESYGLKVPFMRPDELATDTAGTYEVLLHALGFYEQAGHQIERVVLLQVTSPFRKPEHVQDALSKYTSDADMVVSVFETEANPYFVLMEEDGQGYLQKSKKLGAVTRRQDAPKVWQLNGAVYVINAASLKKYKAMAEFPRIVKSEMDALHSQDLDNMTDWLFCEFLIERGLVQLPGSKAGQG